MPTGLALPIGVSASGGVKLVDGDDNDKKIIALALGSDDNENAFQQDIGLGIDMIFGISDPGIRGRIINRLKAIFRNFQAQQRFSLFTASIKFTEDSKTQELILEFKYLNLESDEIKDFRRQFTAT